MHFDLKPSNIMVTPSRLGRQVKVLDFGLAGLRGATGQVMGPPQYLAPAIATRQKPAHRSLHSHPGVLADHLQTWQAPTEPTTSPIVGTVNCV